MIYRDDKTTQEWLTKYPYLKGSYDALQCLCGNKPHDGMFRPWIASKSSGLAGECDKCGCVLGVSAKLSKEDRAKVAQLGYLLGGNDE